ncbi:hypothetical protein CLOM_g21520 [Closterium sp. NIES-68]|nr:hypothetical protein CLOM_g21520 [Closterium sp. NIES-68]
MEVERRGERRGGGEKGKGVRGRGRGGGHTARRAGGEGRRRVEGLSRVQARLRVLGDLRGEFQAIGPAEIMHGRRSEGTMIRIIGHLYPQVRKTDVDGPGLKGRGLKDGG